MAGEAAALRCTASSSPFPPRSRSSTPGTPRSRCQCHKSTSILLFLMLRQLHTGGCATGKSPIILVPGPARCLFFPHPVLPLWPESGRGLRCYHFGLFLAVSNPEAPTWGTPEEAVCDGSCAKAWLWVPCSGPECRDRDSHKTLYAVTFRGNPGWDHLLLSHRN